MTALILVIDDDVLIRESVKRILEDNDFQVLSAANGRKGLALALKSPPALVLIDILMPEQDGIETIIAILRERPAARIIAMSAGGSQINYKECLAMATALGVSDTLVKPFTPDELLERIDRCWQQQ